MVRALATLAWLVGATLCLVCGVVSAVAGAEEWKGVEAGTTFLFVVLFFGGLVALGMRAQRKRSRA